MKDILTSYQNNDYQMDETVNITELTAAMLREIGNIEPILRDELIYSSFCQMILKSYYSDTELKGILRICMDNDHLFYKIGDVETDSVFTRSFSTLIIAVILHVNLEQDFLSSNEIEEVTTLLMDFLGQEQDIRGLVQGKGWAHSIAHVADALDELAKQPKLRTENLKVIFNAIINKMALDQEYFQSDEDERMVIPVVSMLKKGLEESIVCEKNVEFKNDMKQTSSIGDQSYFIYRANVKQFLSSLYFHLEAKERNAEIRKSIKQAISEINQAYYQV